MVKVIILVYFKRLHGLYQLGHPLPSHLTDQLKGKTSACSVFQSRKKRWSSVDWEVIATEWNRTKLNYKLIVIVSYSFVFYQAAFQNITWLCTTSATGDCPMFPSSAKETPCGVGNEVCG